MLANRVASTAASMKAPEVSSLDGNLELHSSRNKNKRRFSDEQIRSLESMFVRESRPDPQMKQQLANQLGLQPRQVAIWFQNKRARSKSKLIEQEYNMLKSSYDTLASKFDSSKKENQCLLIQLKRLRSLMGKPQGIRSRAVGQTGESMDEEHDNVNANTEAEKKTNLLYDCYNHENWMTLRDDSSENVEYFGEETDILNAVELVPDGSLTSFGNWCNFEEF